MNTPSYRVLQVLLWGICAAHIALGLGVNLSPGFTQWVAECYGASVDWTPQFIYILKPLGAFMIALGVLAAGAALDPVKNRLIPYGFVVLFVLRSLQRLIFRQEIQEAFSIVPWRQVTQTTFFLVMAVVLLYLQRQVARAGGGAAAAGG